MALIVVTGLSGAGKSIAINALEDMGYYCVDNLPPKFLVSFRTSRFRIQELLHGVRKEI